MKSAPCRTTKSELTLMECAPPSLVADHARSAETMPPIFRTNRFSRHAAPANLTEHLWTDGKHLVAARDIVKRHQGVPKDEPVGKTHAPMEAQTDSSVAAIRKVGSMRHIEEAERDGGATDGIQ
jgi:hypothetical protein